MVWLCEGLGSVRATVRPPVRCPACMHPYTTVLNCGAVDNQAVKQARQRRGSGLLVSCFFPGRRREGGLQSQQWEVELALKVTLGVLWAAVAESAKQKLFEFDVGDLCQS
jgi:hypothetical protein